jgi:hypothetical protein
MDMAVISASKTFVVGPSGAAWYANILTDTAGTASAGTQVTSLNSAYYLGSNISNDIWVASFVGNTVKIAMSSAAQYSQVTFDCSGSSPVASSGVTASASVGTLAYSSQTNSLGVRQPTTLFSGTSAYAISYSANTPLDVLMTGTSIIKLPPTNISQTISVVGGFPGATSSEGWLLGGTSSNGNAGLYQINKVEVAE